MTKPKLIGSYRLGDENIEVWSDASKAGAQVNFAPEDGSRSNMILGFADADWREVFDCLLHESFEFLCARKGLVLQPLYYSCGQDDTQTRRFHFSHEDFVYLCTAQSVFIQQVASDLARAFKAELKARKHA